MKFKYSAIDSNGELYWYQEKPEISRDGTYWRSAADMLLIADNQPADDWENSCRPLMGGPLTIDNFIYHAAIDRTIYTDRDGCAHVVCYGDHYSSLTFPLEIAAPEEPKDGKSSNPKDAIGSSKLPLHIWPEAATAFGCVGLANGAFKYGRSNWRETGVRVSIYVDAAKRHINDWFEGEECDPEDGVHNLSAALACLAIIIDAMCSDKLHDDRQYPTGAWRKAREMMEPHVDRLKKLHDGRDPKHWTIADKKVD